MKKKYQLNFESHPDTCKLCNEEYYAKEFCLKHYQEDFKKKFKEKIRVYQKNYQKDYWKKMKTNPTFMEKRNSYMKKYLENKARKEQLANESKSENIKIDTELLQISRS